MRRRRWKERLRGWKLAIILSLLMAFLVMGISLFLSSFYSYRETIYEPKDIPRGELLERQEKEKPSP